MPWLDSNAILLSEPDSHYWMKKLCTSYPTLEKCRRRWQDICSIWATGTLVLIGNESRLSDWLCHLLHTHPSIYEGTHGQLIGVAPERGWGELVNPAPSLKVGFGHSLNMKRAFAPCTFMMCHRWLNAPDTRKDIFECADHKIANALKCISLSLSNFSPMSMWTSLLTCRFGKKNISTRYNWKFHCTTSSLALCHL